jgi:hypothetical protein
MSQRYTLNTATRNPVIDILFAFTIFTVSSRHGGANGCHQKDARPFESPSDQLHSVIIVRMGLASEFFETLFAIVDDPL